MDKFSTYSFCSRRFRAGHQDGSLLFDFFIYITYIRIFFLDIDMFNCDVLFFVLQYQNCLRRFFYNTDSNVLLYLARTHYEAEQWQDCKRTLLRAIHLAPSNYTLRFDAGVTLQKFSASTLQKTKRTVEEVKNANYFWFSFYIRSINNLDKVSGW